MIRVELSQGANMLPDPSNKNNILVFEGTFWRFPWAKPGFEIIPAASMMKTSR